MSLLSRFALPALALASTALAVCDKDFTIKSSGDASSLSSCSSYDGSLTIDSKTSDDIALNGITELKGDLILTGNSAIKRLSASDLETITGELRIDDVQNLVQLSFPKLTEVDKIKLVGLPVLRTLDFSASINKTSEIDVENTQLESLKGINPDTAKTIKVANNKGITEVSMQVKNITGSLDVSHNNEELEILFPNLKAANNITFRSASKIDLSSLEQVNSGSIGIYESSSLESFAAPNLTKIDEALTIAQNENLKNVSFPKLQSVGGNLQIANNTNLHDISQFPELKSVGAALDLSGNLTKVETPKINLVVGVFNLQSTGDLGKACTDFYDPLNQKGKLGPKNKYVCKGMLEEAKTAGSPTTGTTGGTKPTGAASPLHVQNAYLGLGALAAVFFV